MSRFTHHKYTWKKPFSFVNHSWELVSAQGAVSFHVSIHTNNDASCGLEFHSARPVGDRAPDHLACPLIGGRCWHDGTSLYATEWVWPLVKPMLKDGDHDAIFRVLEREHDKNFKL